MGGEVINHTLIYLGLGMTAGILSGLLGIGGGTIVVPGLAFLFKHLGIPHDTIMHMAVGTSLATMIVTTGSTTFHNQQDHAIQWSFWKRFAPSIILGVLLGAFIAHFLTTFWLRLFFGVFLLIISIRMFLLIQLKPEHGLPSPWWIRSVGLVIGGKSGLLGVGGGVLMVPFLVHSNVSLRHATATSVACGLLIALIGTLAYAAIGYEHERIISVSWNTGYVYWPAFIGVGIGSISSSHFGVWLGRFLPANIVKRIFAVVLFAIAMHLILGI